jgi:predicted transcriptional regulator
MPSHCRTSNAVDEQAQDLLNHVAGTPLRIEILSTVADEPMDLRDLSDRLRSPRTTVRHNLDKMIDANLITETIERNYRCTSVGWAVLTGLETFAECLDAALRLESLFECFPPTEFGLDVSALTDAEVTTASRAEPYAPSRRLWEVIEQSEEIAGFLPINPFLFGPPDCTAIQRGECSVSLFVTDDVVTILRDELESTSENCLGQDDFELWTVPERRLEYGLAIADEKVLILGLDENDKPHVLVEATGASCREWAGQRLDRLRTRATRLEKSHSKGNNW